MLIKEYRIAMPLSVQQYRIAQLYMIQKKSREESQGTESGVEIIENQPYTDGPGGSGQYTQKVYHISKHIPGWLVAILPKDALIVEEEGWNAYPYTRTRYTCPFVEKFSIDIETLYFDDAGEQDNVFNLSPAELRNRILDEIDIVKEQVSDYTKEEDPRFFKSIKTGLGPLKEDWLSKTKNTPPDARDTVMCAYKMCKVEFKYWGMQSKIEKFIHDTGLRRVMLRAHKQAWCWQDEWHDLTISDIRRLEKETQLALQQKFGSPPLEELGGTIKNGLADSETPPVTSPISQARSNDFAELPRRGSTSSFSRVADNRMKLIGRRSSTTSVMSARSRHSYREAAGSPHISGLAELKIETIRRDSSDWSSDDDEFFDCIDDLPPLAGLHSLSKYKWGSSLENLADNSHEVKSLDLVGTQLSLEQEVYAEQGLPDMANLSPSPCKISALFLVLHGGIPLEAGNQKAKESDVQTLRTTLETVMSAHYRSVADHVAIRLVACPAVCGEAYQLLHNLNPLSAAGDDSGHSQTLPSALVSLFATASSSYDDVVQSLVGKCNAVYGNFLTSEEGRGFAGQVCVIGDAAGSIMAYDLLCKYASKQPPRLTPFSRRASSLSNHEDEERTNSSSSLPPSPGFRLSPPQTFRDPSGKPRRSSACPSLGGSPYVGPEQASLIVNRNMLFPSTLQYRRVSDQGERSSSMGSVTSLNGPHLVHQASISSVASSNEGQSKLDFDVTEFFMLGSCLGYILAMRRFRIARDSASATATATVHTPLQPACRQAYNLFYAADPSSARLEPLIHPRFTDFPPINVTNYQVFPLGDGQPTGIGDFLSSTSETFIDSSEPLRRPSQCSISSGMIDNAASSAIANTPAVHGALSLCEDTVFDHRHAHHDHHRDQHHDRHCDQHHDHHRDQHHDHHCDQHHDHHCDQHHDHHRDQHHDHHRDPHRGHSDDHHHITDMNGGVAANWWGEKRMDYALFYPEALSDFPSSSLPHLFHASFWESADLAAFVLRQIFQHEGARVRMNDGKCGVEFVSSLPREKWQKKRNQMKLRNVTANHRARDGVALESTPQTISGKFMYGPLDMVTLTGEKVDVHIMTPPPSSEWVYLGTELTNNHGKVTFTVGESKRLGLGIYPVKMVVRGDHTCADSYLAVLPPQTDCVVFSIDGSFTASVSIMGSDPKVRPGAVDVVRLWQDHGYMIMYVTARPDMQKQRVVSWLAQHNFPHGLVWFSDGLVHDPLKQKTVLLKQLKSEYKLNFAAAYGSSKDIAVYLQLGLDPRSIYVVGKATKKQAHQCTWLHDGYSAHLEDLLAKNGVQPAKYNAQVLLRKGCFGLPGQMPYMRSRTLSSKKRRPI